MAASYAQGERRVIYNDDGGAQFDNPANARLVTDEESYLDARLRRTFNTDVDTYVWCVGCGAWPRLGDGSVLPFLGSFENATRLIVDTCRDHRMEVWGSLRMNDLHDSFSCKTLKECYEPIKGERPEYLLAPPTNRALHFELRERALWTALDFSLREVREYRWNFVEWNAAEFDFDGYELDFSRFIWNFPLGEERRHAHEMTEFVGGVRERLEVIGGRRGREYGFAVHVMDSPALSLELGQDVETWLAESLVDALVVGMGYLPYELRLDQWLELGRRYGVPVYPSVNMSTYCHWSRDVLGRESANAEAIRASSAYYWQEGADGLYFFNWFAACEDAQFGLPFDAAYAPLREIGGPDALARKDKLYSIQPSAQSGYCCHGSAAAWLPAPLDNYERKLPLRIGPDAGDARAAFRLSLRVSGDRSNKRIWLRLNHVLLPDAAEQGDWYRVDLPIGVLRCGTNELSVWCGPRDPEDSERSLAPVIDRDPIIVHQVFVEARY